MIDIYNKKYQVVIIVILLIIGALYMFGMTETFDNNSSNPIEMKQEEENIPPQYFNKDVRSLMAGSGFIPQKEVIPPWGDSWGNSEILDDGAKGDMGLHYNLCSPSCCSEQWPTPHKLPYDKYICKNKDNFAPNSYTCSNQWQNSGCLCMTKDQRNFLSNRGNNA